MSPFTCMTFPSKQSSYIQLNLHPIIIILIFTLFSCFLWNTGYTISFSMPEYFEGDCTTQSCWTYGLGC